MCFNLIIFDNEDMQEIKNIVIDEVSSLKSACKIAELHEEKINEKYPDTTVVLERLDDA